MQNLFKTKTVLCGAALLAMLPLGGIFTPAQADTQAPVYRAYNVDERPNGGFVLVDDDDDDNDDRRARRNENRGNGYGRANRNGRGNGVGRNNRGETDVLRGVVLNRSNGNSFQVRATDGRVYNVVTDNGIIVQRGAQVRIRGEVSGNTFRARAVTILDRDAAGNGGNGNSNGDSNETVNFTATVTRVIDMNEYRVRATDGRTFEVRTEGKLSGIRVGDRVRVSGERDGDRIRRAQFNRIAVGEYGNDNGYNYGNGGYGNGGTNGVGSRVDFAARIVSIGQARNNAQVRASNGQTYKLRSTNGELNGLNVGDRIRVRGTANGDIIQVSDLSRAR